LLLRGQVDEAVMFLVDLVQRDLVFEEFRNEVIALRARNILLFRLHRQRLMSEEEFWLRWNQIVNQILAIKDELPERAGEATPPPG